ncbi:MAG: primase-helicase family protein [Paracoccaceae bacterium]
MQNTITNLNVTVEEFGSENALPNGQQDTLYNAATVIGDLTSPESKAVLNSTLICGAAQGAPRVASDKWERFELSFEDALYNLTRHPIQKDKEGLALFYNEGEQTGNTQVVDGHKVVFVHRTKNTTKAVTAVALDIDGTDSVDRVRDRLVELGLFAVIYTTHGHARKSTPDCDLFRVIMPLEEPFRVSDHGGTVRKASEEWLSKYIGLCGVLGIEKPDASGAKFAQMMYTPRRASEDAEYRHYLIAGRALKLSDMPSVDVSHIKKGSGRAGHARQREGSSTRSPAILKNGFDVHAWHADWGAHFDLELFFDIINWDVRNPNAGDGMAILCANHCEHSEPDDGEDVAAWGCQPYDGKGFLLTCLHDHCGHLCTWDFLRLMEEGIEAGDAMLPDGFECLSDVLISPLMYPDEVDGEVVTISASDYGVVKPIVIKNLGTPNAVQKVYDAIVEDPNATDEDFALVCAGVLNAGNKRAAKSKLDALLKSDPHFNGNDITKLHSIAGALIKSAQATKKQVADEQFGEMFSKGLNQDLAHESMDIAAPLGETLEEAVATLEKRYGLVNIGGRFRALLKASENDGSLLVTTSKEDFVSFHSDRMIEQKGDQPINAASVYFKYGPRYSRIAFSPPPNAVSDTTLNLYRGTKLNPMEGDCTRLKEFILNTVCNGRNELFKFVWLYLAHMVQYPGRKPGTAIVLRGEGGTGKSSFGLILEKLTAPHCATIANQDQVTGRFSGEHLSTSIMCICTEALFAGDPKVNGVLKNLITAPTMLVEPKGLPAIEMPSYCRFYFDSNSYLVVPIDGNGSERRYLVMQINEDHKEDKEYFKPLYEELNGAGMAALMWELQHYDPASDDMDWEMLRTAPDTPERRQMRWYSMRPAERKLIQVFEDGVLEVKAESGKTYRYDMDAEKAFRIPIAELRKHLAMASNKYEAKDGDIVQMMEDLFGAVLIGADEKEIPTASLHRGIVKCFHLVAVDEKNEEWEDVTREGERFVEFPPLKLLRAELVERYDRQ